MERGGDLFFSHGTNHSKGVCILIDPSVNYQIDYSYANTSGLIILIAITLGSQKDLASVERALKLVEEFGKITGLCLNVKKTKAIWLGKWANNTSNPLGMK